MPNVIWPSIRNLVAHALALGDGHAARRLVPAHSPFATIDDGDFDITDLDRIHKLFEAWANLTPSPGPKMNGTPIDWAYAIEEWTGPDVRAIEQIKCRIDAALAAAGFLDPFQPNAINPDSDTTNPIEAISFSV